MAFYENETLEYKRQYTPDIKKEVVAFANTAGGAVYIGIDDDGTPVGVQDPDAVVQQLTNALRDGIRPDVTSSRASPFGIWTAAPWSWWRYPLAHGGPIT